MKYEKKVLHTTETLKFKSHALIFYLLLIKKELKCQVIKTVSAGFCSYY